jgi:hypothetical protein
MTPAAIEQSTKRIAFLHAESYAEYAFRFCAERTLPWRDEYAIPDPSNPLGPRAAAKQARGLKTLNNRKGP